MENIKYIDITQLPEDLWQDAKNLIAIDSNGDVIKAEKQDSYSKEEIDELLKEHQDISNLATKEELATKQDKLVSGTNIKTINGVTLLGEGNITIEGGSGNVDLSDYYTKSETNSLVNPKLSQVTLTQAEYDALSTKKENVLYIISDASNVDPSDYYTKAEIDSMIGGVSSTITEINNLVV